MPPRRRLLRSASVSSQRLYDDYFHMTTIRSTPIYFSEKVKVAQRQIHAMFFETV